MEKAEPWIARYASGERINSFDTPSHRFRDAERMRASWRAWSSAVSSLGDEHAPLLRLRPEALKELIGRVAHKAGVEGSTPGRGNNLMPSPDEEKAAYARDDPYAP